MFKIFGALLIIGGFALFGLSRYLSFKMRCNYLLEIRSLLGVLKNEIELKSTPLSDAFGMIGRKYDSELFILISEKIKQFGSADGLNASLSEFAGRRFLNKEDIDALLTLGGGLGKCSKKGQVERIEYTCSLIDNRITFAQRDKNEKSRLVLNTSLLSGVALALILL